jgi:DNA-binding transcriptional LysR family regulator
MSRLPDFEGWAVFAKVAEVGSFAGAAEELGMSKATVSKAVARLEQRLGARLFHRSSRRLALSEAGRALASAAAALLAGGEAAEAEALAQSSGPRGRLKLAVPMTFGVQHIAPAMPDFLAAFPELTVDLHLSDEIVDLIAGGYDAALRIAALADSALVARRLCAVNRWLVGAPAYFARNGRPERPRDLAGHDCLGYAYSTAAATWRFVDGRGREEAVAVAGTLRANNGEALLPALRAGRGVAVLPDFMIWADLEAGRLERAMTGWAAPEVALHIVMPPGTPRPPKVTALIDFMVKRFAEGALPWSVAR